MRQLATKPVVCPPTVTAAYSTAKGRRPLRRRIARWSAHQAGGDHVAGVLVADAQWLALEPRLLDGAAHRQCDRTRGLSFSRYLAVFRTEGVTWISSVTAPLGSASRTKK